MHINQRNQPGDEEHQGRDGQYEFGLQAHRLRRFSPRTDSSAPVPALTDLHVRWHFSGFLRQFEPKNRQVIHERRKSFKQRRYTSEER
jgi:hypothetical protein